MFFDVFTEFAADEPKNALGLRGHVRALIRCDTSRREKRRPVAALDKPRDARVTGKTVTGNIDTEFDGLDESLGIMDDLIPQFAPANQKFVDDYNNARRIVDAAASHASPVKPQPAPQVKA